MSMTALQKHVVTNLCMNQDPNLPSIPIPSHHPSTSTAEDSHASHHHRLLRANASSYGGPNAMKKKTHASCLVPRLTTDNKEKGGCKTGGKDKVMLKGGKEAGEPCKYHATVAAVGWL